MEDTSFFLVMRNKSKEIIATDESFNFSKYGHRRQFTPHRLSAYALPIYGFKFHTKHILTFRHNYEHSGRVDNLLNTE